MVSATRMFFRLSAWIFVIPLFFGLVIGWLAVSDIRKASLLDEEVAEGVARITALHVGSDTNSRPGRESSSAYSIIYEYEVDGETYEADQGINEEFYQGLGVGDEIPVFYAPSEPRVSEVERGVAAGGAVWISIVALIFLAVAALLGWWRFRLVASAVRAGKSGAKRQAKVDEVKEAQSRIGSGRRVQVVWRKAKGGQHSSRRIAPDHAERWSPGGEIAVWTDPKTGREWSEADLE
jgi:hypothetical protein